ncbi:MAG: MarR family winged helix-turn-helix transcriptional regulator [Puia sp.]|nr:MarR family winged helix-turn-helix transcriptional regulator [Puia sp.]
MYEPEHYYLDSPYLCVGTMARSMEKMAQKACKPLGVSPGMAYLLLFVLDYPFRDHRELSENMMMSHAMITRMVQTLKEKGLVQPEQYDKHKIVCATAAGQGLAMRLADWHEIISRKYLLAFGGEQGPGFMQAMRRAAKELLSDVDPRPARLASKREKGAGETLSWI